MYSVFTELGKKMYEHNNHYGFLIKWNLISPLCKKWSRNRDPDKNRIEDMITYYHNGGYLPRFIHMAELSDENLVCYDGNHRREVFNALQDVNYCVIDVMFNVKQQDVYDAFDNINKSVQLPAIYLDDNKDILQIKQDMINLVKTYEQRYKNFISTSNRYHAPNFNRDIFIENLYDLYKHMNGNITVVDLEQLLEQLNNMYAQEKLCRKHSTYSNKIITKCKKYNFWLFLNKTIPSEHIEQLYLNLK